MAILLTKQTIEEIKQAYARAKKRVFLLDYDGTLVDFAPTPGGAMPTPQLLDILSSLSGDTANTLAIVSGRDQYSLHRWLGHLPIGITAEHGQFVRLPGVDWRRAEPADESWKTAVRALFEPIVASVPGALIEEKQTSLCLHYRRSPAGMAEGLLPSLKNQLASLGLVVLPGDKVLEARKTTLTKAAAFDYWPARQADFLLIAGDDTTDEHMFEVASPKSYTIKVGTDRPTAARFALASPQELLALLSNLAA